MNNSNPRRSNNKSSYFDCIDRIASPDYVPTDQDILRSWVESIFITETFFPSSRCLELNYRVFNVGGRRSERRKWIHVFKDVAVIIFLVDVSDYDQTLLEDPSANRMQESLVLFESICNSRWFVNTSIVLFFTKIDILKDKVATSPFNHYFLDFSGDPTNLESVKSYIEMRFLSLDKNPDRKIDVHFTSLDPDTSLGETAFATIEKHLHLQEEEKRAKNEKSG